ncbi:MAG: hypothetical protein NUV32_08895 [Exilispira sp.]|jgi:hypothetical protein|nr:hypothetical protein [Exilispira sp.]
MSTVVKAFILRQLMDQTIIEEALKEMNINYKKIDNNIVVNNYISIEILKTGSKLKYRTTEFWNNLNINQFIADLTEIYTKILDERIQKLKFEELKIKEKTYFEKVEEEEKKREQLEIERERIRLEAIKRKEEAELKKQIEEKTELLKKKAMQLGYQIKEEVHGNEKVLVLVRR